MIKNKRRERDKIERERDRKKNKILISTASQARVYRLLGPAELALDFAAPVERAIAPLDDDDLLRLVASPAAHEVAAVDADARVVALPAVSAENTEFRIFLAERRRRLEVDQVLDTRRLVLRIVRLQLEVVAVPSGETVAVRVYRVARRVARDGVADASGSIGVAHHDARGTVETVLQVVADLAERRQPHPAGFDGTRTRHPVTLALLAHLR